MRREIASSNHHREDAAAAAPERKRGRSRSPPLRAAPRPLPVTIRHVIIFSLAEEDQKSSQTDRRSSTSPQLNALASQQPPYMTLFMDVIGFESWSQPLGGILSESGAFAQLAQGMAPFLGGQFWHCVGI